MSKPDDPATTATEPQLASKLRAPATLFAPGDFVADRYRIVALRGRGGMGEVYEAEDLELGTRIALKTLRQESLADERAIERLKRELLLARRITHANVCRLFDIGQHQSEGGEAVLFLTMELLEGKTLAESLQQGGRLSLDRAAAIAGRMAAALDAAHEAGVVHRDFKSSNVVLCADGRVVVTDFGLALAVVSGSAASASSDAFAGSPAYMAPEQIEGGPTSPATDVYAFGVVLFEMVTATLPFLGETPLATAVKRLKEPAPSPRSVVPDLDPAWERTILRCLSPRPADRFARCAEVVLAFGGAQIPAARKAPRLLVTMLALVAVVGLGVLGWRMSRRTHAGASPTARKTVALLNLGGLRPDHAAHWIGRALPNMLESELSLGDRWRAVAGDTVARVTRGMPPMEGDLTPDAVAHLGNLLGADAIVSGRLAPQEGGRLNLVLTVYDTPTRSARGQVEDTVAESDLLNAASRLGVRIRAVLGAEPLSATDSQLASAAHSRNAEAERCFAEGMEHYRRLDFTQAQQLLEKAVAADPNFALAHSALAGALSSLGFQDRARLEAHRALELAGRLSREDQLRIQARVHVADGEWSKAAEVQRELWKLAPENLDYGLSLVIDQSFGGQAQEALVTLAEVRRRAGARAGDPMIDLREAVVAEALQDWERELAAANRAYDAARKRGERALEPEAAYYRGGAYIGMGKNREAIAALEEARRIYDELGDRGGVGYILSALGETRAKLGDFDQALRDAQQALAIFRAIGDELHASWNMGAIARIYQMHGERTKALEYYEQALSMHRARRDRKGIATNLENIGAVLIEQGRYAEAEQMFREALPINRALGRRDSIAASLGNLADIQARSGHLPEALRQIDEAIVIAREVKNAPMTGSFLNVRGAIETDQGNFAAARKSIEEALALDTPVGDPRLIDDSRTLLAKLALEEHRADLAIQMAREVADVAKRRGDDDAEAAARNVLVRSLLVAGRVPEAAEAFARVEALAKASDDRALPLHVALTRARLAAARGQRDAAERELRRVERDARKNGLIGIRLDAVFALAAANQAARAEVVEDARRHGFGRLMGSGH